MTPALLVLVLACTRGADSRSPDHSGSPDESGQDSTPDSHDTRETDSPADSPIDSPVDTNPVPPPCEPHLPYTLDPADPLPGQPLTVRYTGTLAGSAMPGLRYGYNGWNSIGEGLPYQSLNTVGDIDFWLDAPLTVETDGSASVTFDVPDDARSVHLRFFAGPDDSTRVWDDDSGREYGASIVFPYIGPFLTWDAATSPSGGVVVNFETSLPCPAHVEFGTTSALGSTVGDDVADPMHHVELTGLAPDTTYTYRVVDGEGRMSDTFQFRTAPADMSRLEYVVLADMQDGGDGRTAWKELADALAWEHPDADFLMLGGDMPTSDMPGRWWTFFDKARALFASKVIMPAVGNHDTPNGDAYDPDTTSFDRYFRLPEPGGVYSFQVGPAWFLVLDSDRAEAEFIEGGAQYLWTQSELAAPPADARWVFTNWHRPPYEAGARFLAEQPTIRAVTELFDGEVDWVFTGHSHSYQRIVPLRFDSLAMRTYGRGSADGVGYIVTPSSGIEPKHDMVHADDPTYAYLRDLVAYPEIHSDTSAFGGEIGWMHVALQDETIRIEAWGMGRPGALLTPHVIDQLQYTR